MNQKILNHFKKADPIIYKAALKTNLEDRPKLSPDQYFVELIDTVVSQQLSGKAATTIFGRLKNLMPKGLVSPKSLIRLTDEEIRAAGISYAKIRYIKGIAQEVIEGNLPLKEFDKQSDEVVKDELIKLKGIGPWSAEMFLMFSLGRPDIFSTGDLGLKNAIKKLYGFQNDPTIPDMEKISSKWSPYRTYACRVLWASLSSDN